MAIGARRWVSRHGAWRGNGAVWLACFLGLVAACGPPSVMLVPELAEPELASDAGYQRSAAAGLVGGGFVTLDRSPYRPALVVHDRAGRRVRTVRLPAGSASWGEPAVLADTHLVALPEQPRSVRIIDAGSGRTVAALELRAAVSGVAAVRWAAAGERLMVETRVLLGAAVQAIDPATGILAWERAVGAPTAASPDGAEVVLWASGMLLAVDALSGEEVFALPLPYRPRRLSWARRGGWLHLVIDEHGVERRLAVHVDSGATRPKRLDMPPLAAAEARFVAGTGWQYAARGTHGLALLGPSESRWQLVRLASSARGVVQLGDGAFLAVGRRHLHKLDVGLLPPAVPAPRLDASTLASAGQAVRRVRSKAGALLDLALEDPSGAELLALADHPEVGARASETLRLRLGRMPAKAVQELCLRHRQGPAFCTRALSALSAPALAAVVRQAGRSDLGTRAAAELDRRLDQFATQVEAATEDGDGPELTQHCREGARLLELVTSAEMRREILQPFASACLGAAFARSTPEPLDAAAKRLSALQEPAARQQAARLAAFRPAVRALAAASCSGAVCAEARGWLVQGPAFPSRESCEDGARLVELSDDAIRNLLLGPLVEVCLRAPSPSAVVAGIDRAACSLRALQKRRAVASSARAALELLRSARQRLAREHAIARPRRCGAARSAGSTWKLPKRRKTQPTHIGTF